MTGATSIIKELESWGLEYVNAELFTILLSKIINLDLSISKQICSIKTYFPYIKQQTLKTFLIYHHTPLQNYAYLTPISFYHAKDLNESISF